MPANPPRQAVAPPRQRPKPALKTARINSVMRAPTAKPGLQAHIDAGETHA